MQSTKGATAGSGNDQEQSFSLTHSVLLIRIRENQFLEAGDSAYLIHILYRREKDPGKSA
jgi:hypothetical protein